MDKILIASIVLVLWSLFFRKFHCRHDVRPAFGTELPNVNSLNGCGASLFGGFRVANSDKYVYYIMLTALFLPFIPLGCVVAKKKGTEDALLGISTQYEIFGKTKMIFWELIWCYVSRWGILLFVISFFLFFSSK